MNRAGTIILLHELRRLIAEPFTLLSFVAFSTFSVILRIFYSIDCPALLILEFTFYGFIIGMVCFHVGSQGLKERKVVEMQIERGVGLYAGFVRIIVQSALSLLLCSIGLVYSGISSEIELEFWIYLWVTSAGTSFGLIAITHALTITFITKTFNYTSFVSLLELALIGGIYAIYIFIGIMLTEIIASLTLKALLAAGYACLFATGGIALFLIVAKRMPRRMSTCRQEKIVEYKEDIPSKDRI